LSKSKRPKGQEALEKLINVTLIVKVVAGARRARAPDANGKQPGVLSCPAEYGFVGVIVTDIDRRVTH
jgi:hypothetical protein